MMTVTMSAEQSDSKQDVQVDSKADLLLRGRIDQSLRWPLLFFFVAGALWLLAAIGLGLLSSLVLNVPGLFEGFSFLQYGRLQPAFTNALIYGWALQVAFGVSYWLIARLGRTPLRSPIGLLVAGKLWNVTVALGVLAILMGWGTSVAWLDFPKPFWPVLLIIYLLLMVGLVGLFAVRRCRAGFISQWYVLAAAFWFPWVYVSANLLIHSAPGAAVFKAAVDGWYISNLLYMVLTPVGLASALYLVSKTTGREIFSRDLTRLGFWLLIALTGWTGFSRYMGGPLPAWIPSVSGAAAVFLLIPVLAVVVNFFKTMDSKAEWALYSPALRFSLFGIVALLVTVSLGAILAVIPLGKGLQFTFAQTSFELLGIYAFFSMSMFGAVYFIVPRLVGCEWPNGGLIRFHFWLSAYGIIAMAAFTLFGGLAQGHLQAQWMEDFVVSLERSKPYLAALPVGWLLILLSNLAFFLQLALMAVRYGRQTGEGPTLIHKQPEEYFTERSLAVEKANA